jgi:uncharacterized coiled-coil protein SlyX
MIRNNQPTPRPASTLIGAMADKRIAELQDQITAHQKAIRILSVQIRMLEKQKADSEQNARR